MKRTLIILFALILTSCTGIATHDWCYTYDFSQGVNSANEPFNIIQGILTGTGIMSENGVIDVYSIDSVFEGTGAVSYEVKVYNPGAAFMVGIVGFVFETELSVYDPFPPGMNTFITSATGSGGSYIGANISSANPSDVFYLIEGTVYGTGVNPFPRNDCAPDPTPTPAPWVYATIAPQDDPEGEGTQTRFDYIISAGDVMVSVLLLATLVSIWSMFIYSVIRDGDE